MIEKLSIKDGEIPNGWAISSIGDVAIYVNGRAFKPSEWGVEGLPIIRIQNLNDEKAKYNYSIEEHERKYLVEFGDLLFAWSASLGAYIWKGGDAWLNQHIFRVIPYSGVDRKFLFYLFSRITAELYAKTHGSGMVHVTKGKFEETEIIIPPTNEQKRIVDKIEELFSELDNGIRCLLISKQQLAGYYQSVLNDSFSKVAEYKLLENLLSEKMSNGYSGKPVKYETEYKVLSLSSTTSGIFQDNYFKFLDEEGLKNRDIWCKPNDILVQRGNTIEYVGVPAIYTGLPDMFIFPDLMIRLKADENVVTTKFLYYALSSPKTRNYLRSKAKGSAGTMPKINQSILASVQIPYCPIDVQIELVKEIERKLSYCLILKKVIEDSIAMAEILRKSILNKAFSGKLVAQDANDEPASVLLERIRTEKETYLANNMSKHQKEVNSDNEFAQDYLIEEAAV